MEINPIRNPSYFYPLGISNEFLEEDEEANIDHNLFETKKITVEDIIDTFVSSGDEWLDNRLRGGFLCSGITEFAGESGSGKTQLGLQLCLTVQRNSSNLGAIYISTESAFPSKRLVELTNHFRREENFPRDAMSNIFVEHALDGESLMNCVEKRLTILCKQRKIGLIVLDSIAAIYRSDYTKIYERAKDLRIIAKKLYEISRDSQLLVVVINQVSAKMTRGSSCNGNRFTPSLGLAWTNLVTNRFLLLRNGSERSIKVVFSPYLRVQVLPIKIESSGISSNEKFQLSSRKRQ